MSVERISQEKQMSTDNQHLEVRPALDTDAENELTGGDPPGYVNGRPFWQNYLFIGTYLALCLGLSGYYAAFAMPSNTLAIINADIGPSLAINWVSTGFTLSAAVSTMIIGRTSDLFGRRYFFIGGSALATIGSIVASTSKTVNQLIGATVLCGAASGVQSAYVYVIAEMVPFKYRYFMVAVINITTVPVAAFGPLVARAFILHTSAQWRWNYYFAIIINGVATVLWIFCYFPPTFNILHSRRTKWQQFLKTDFLGLFLFASGFLLFLLGLSWGGSSYPWKSTEVLCTLVIGAVTLIAFVVWETLSGIEEPFFPMSFFRNYQYDFITVMAVVGGMVYYSSAILYPTMIEVLFTTEIYRVGLYTCAPTAGTCFGLFAGGLVSEKFSIKYQYIFFTCSLTAFVGALAACGEMNLAMVTAFAVLGSFSVGYLELLTEGSCTIVQADQMSLGTAVSIINSLRTGGGSIAATVYIAILTNRVTANIKTIVVPALLGAGLPATDIAKFLPVLAAGVPSAIESFPGITPQILSAAAEAYKAAYAGAFKVVFLTTIAFGSVAIVSSLFFKEIDEETMQRGVVISLETAAHQDRMIVNERRLDEFQEKHADPV